METKRKTIGIASFIMAVLLSSTAFSYVPIEEYKGIKLKFYDESRRQDLYNIINTIPIDYFKGVNSISVFAIENVRVYADVTNDRNIRIYKYGLSHDVLIHELAHVCQLEKGDHLSQAMMHRGHFDECHIEIWDKSY